MKNENVHPPSGKQPLSELKISLSVKLIVKDDVIVNDRKRNAKISAGNSFLNPLEFKIFLWGKGWGVSLVFAYSVKFYDDRTPPPPPPKKVLFLSTPRSNYHLFVTHHIN